MRICTRSLASRLLKRLVEQEHLGIAHDGAAHGDALALAAGKRLRPPAEQFRNIENARGIFDTLPDLGLGHAPHAEPERHVLEHRHVRIQRVALEHHGDIAVLRRDIVDDAAADADVAVRHVLKARDHPQRRGLAAARRADQRHEFGIGNLKADPAHGLVIAVSLDHISQQYISHSEILSIPVRRVHAALCGCRFFAPISPSKNPSRSSAIT